MKVKELIEGLKKYDPEMDCIFTWESIFTEFEIENIYKGNERLLIFDADGNNYRERFENRTKPEDVHKMIT